MTKQKAMVSSFGAAPRTRVKLLILFVLLLLALAAAWQWESVSQWLTVEKIVAWSWMVRYHPLSSLIVIGAYVAASLVLFPITLLILATAITFGPMLGFAYATTGCLLGAVATYGIGYLLGHDFVVRLSRSTGEMSRSLARHGLVAMIIVHLVPVAPFTLINVAAGAVHVRFRDFVVGTLIGMVPGIGAITIFQHQLEITWRDPRRENFVVLGVLLVAVVLGLVWIRSRVGDAESQ